MPTKRWSLPLVVLSLILAIPASRGRAAVRPLIRPTDKKGSVKIEQDRTVIRQQKVVVNFDVLKGQGNQTLTLPLFDREIVLVRDRQETSRKDAFVWYGHVDRQPGSSVVLSNVKEALAGDVMTRDRTSKSGFFQIRYIGNRVHVLNQIDQSKFPRERSAGRPSLHADPDPCGDPASIVDVLVVYTGAARYAAGGTSGIEAEIDEAIAVANQSYSNSEVAHRLRLVHTEEVSYWESGNAEMDQDRLRDTADGYLDGVLALRNTYAADVVVLILRNLDDCGWTDVMETVTNDFESFAYAVVQRACSVTNYSFPHEIGHIMSARHDRADDKTEGKPFAFNHGLVVDSPTGGGSGWRTIMGVEDGCECTDRIPYWSNPNLRYPPIPSGDPMGADDTDNHGALNATALTVANFRCAAAEVKNVWMKDSWNDTGAEPDPKTAGDVMWASPYIWVRNSRDTTNAHAYDHENPVAGSNNWVYVQLDNGGGTIDGNLEVYWANPSISLTWPSGWTSIANVPVSFTASSPKKVIEVPWTPLQAGHYCLLARWASAADPMTHAETAQIEQNVRDNNNIVWRNLNVIDLAANPLADATFGVGAPDGQGAPFAILVRPHRGQEKASVFQHVRVTVELDDALAMAWRRRGAKGRGFREEGGKIEVSEGGAVLDGLYLEPKNAGRVKLTFQKLPTAPRRDFVIDVVQMRPDDSGETHGRTVGGISYVIRTRRVEAGPVY
jgi:hypothetical protein